MEWISVKDRLPENNVQEILCVRKTINGVYSIPLTWRMNKFYFFLSGYIEINDVTHWMPLPEPPKI